MNVTFWKLVRELLAKKNLTQTGVARSLDINVRTFQDLIYSKKLPDTESAKKIADFLGVSLDYLLTGKTDGGSALSSDEALMLETYRKTPKMYKEIALKVLTDFSQANDPGDNYITFKASDFNEDESDYNNEPPFDEV